MATANRTDSPYSWVIAVACCWVLFVCQGLVRSAGVIYVSLIDTYGVNRAQASWPFTLRIAIWNLSGPIAGALSYRWSIRSITFTGLLIVTLTNALCWFANDITLVTVFLGALQGIGIGMAVTLVPVIINQYFVKYKSTGAGVACSGSTAGSFALPPIVEFTIEEYGLKGAFLMMGGITLHGILGAALMRPAKWLQKKTPNVKSKTLKNHEENHSNNHNDAYICISDTVIQDSKNDKFEKFPESPIKVTSNKTDSTDLNHENNSIQSKTVKFCQQYTQTDSQNNCNEPEAINETSTLLENDESPYKIVRMSADVKKANKIRPRQLVSDSVLDDTEDDPVIQNYQLKFIDSEEISKTCDKTNGFTDDSQHLMTTTSLSTSPGDGREYKNRRSTLLSGIMQPMKIAWSIVRNPMFLIIASNYSIFFLSYMTYLIVIVDYSLDLGVDKTNSVFLVSTFSISDLCGRLGSGWITDSGYVKRKHLMMFNMIALGILLAGTSLANTYISLMAVSVTAGLVVGINLIIFFALLEEYIGIQNMAMAVGLMNFSIGCISFVTPLLTGFFRDTLGSYDHLFHFLGALLIIGGLFWTIEPFYGRCKQKQTPDKSNPTPDPGC